MQRPIDKKRKSLEKLGFNRWQMALTDKIEITDSMMNKLEKAKLMTLAQYGNIIKFELTKKGREVQAKVLELMELCK